MSLAKDAQVIKQLESPGRRILNRQNPWKPRTNPKDWHGLITTAPRTAQDLMGNSVLQGQMLAGEIGKPGHLEQFAPLLALGWIGSRNIVETEFIMQVAREVPDMPLAIKNGMDGTVGQMLELVEEARRQRPNGAPVLPIFRGGTDLSNPRTWIEASCLMHDKTNGQFILDLAHGGEQAHDPSGKFGKTVIGQLAALHSVAHMSALGFKPKGIMAEVSHIDSPTDPNIPTDMFVKLFKETGL